MDSIKTTTRRAHVRVLLATHNSGAWLEEQLQSIVRQTDVQVSVVASDDQSSDSTLHILGRWSQHYPLRLLAPLELRMGNANKNFLRLIKDTPLDDADYFSLADHDDIWHSDKLSRAVETLKTRNFDAYSSNVTAFWPDGRTAYLDKAQPQQLFDHLFESAGPGCTFVFTRQRFMELQRWVINHYEQITRLKVHDWLIYAYARENHWAWHIDPYSGLKYRQHASNEAGANLGRNAARIRWERIRSGKFRQEALEIAEAIGADNEVARRLRRFSLADRLWLALHTGQMRRRPRDQWTLSLFFMLMPSAGHTTDNSFSSARATHLEQPKANGNNHGK